MFFVPDATIVYRGQGAQLQVAAQFISKKLRALGQGALAIRPVYDRAITIPNQTTSTLIR